MEHTRWSLEYCKGEEEGVLRGVKMRGKEEERRGVVKRKSEKQVVVGDIRG